MDSCGFMGLTLQKRLQITPGGIITIGFHNNGGCCIYFTGPGDDAPAYQFFQETSLNLELLGQLTGPGNLVRGWPYLGCAQLSILVGY